MDRTRERILPKALQIFQCWEATCRPCALEVTAMGKLDWNWLLFCQLQQSAVRGAVVASCASSKLAARAEAQPPVDFWDFRRYRSAAGGTWTAGSMGRMTAQMQTGWRLAATEVVLPFFWRKDGHNCSFETKDVARSFLKALSQTLRVIQCMPHYFLSKHGNTLQYHGNTLIS